MLDKQCEIAWRMGRWQEAADLAPSDASGNILINSAVCQSLKVSLQTRSENNVYLMAGKAPRPCTATQTLVTSG